MIRKSQPFPTSPRQDLCCICRKAVPKAERVIEQRKTGQNGSLQSWTYCLPHAPKPPVQIVGSLTGTSPGMAYWDLLK
jgi:hypothetical protein